jgi:hypothetical protein
MKKAKHNVKLASHFKFSFLYSTFNLCKIQVLIRHCNGVHGLLFHTQSISFHYILCA